MLYGKNQSLSERITELLLESPLQIGKLHEKLGNEKSEPSLRAVYKAVNQLTESDVLIKAGKIVRINEEWLRTVRSRLVSTEPLRLSPGERMTYSFSSVAHLDTFWKTIVFQLENLEKDGQIFFYNPHNFWAYLPERKESEDAYYKHFAESKLHAFFTIGGTTIADKEFKRKYQNEYLQINVTVIPSLVRVGHLTILGDHIVTVRIAKNAAQKIDSLYSTDKPIGELIPDLISNTTGKVPSRFTLEHNPLKASKLRKMLSRDFYFGSKLVY